MCLLAGIFSLFMLIIYQNCWVYSFTLAFDVYLPVLYSLSFLSDQMNHSSFIHIAPLPLTLFRDLLWYGTDPKSRTLILLLSGLDVGSNELTGQACLLLHMCCTVRDRHRTAVIDIHLDKEEQNREMYHWPLKHLDSHWVGADGLSPGLSQPLIRPWIWSHGSISPVCCSPWLLASLARTFFSLLFLALCRS